MGRGGVLRVRLAGFNVDADTLKRCQQRVRSPLTPETLSAAYARISRSPLDIVRLRRNARRDVARARASNRTIIFDMGHHSVAEHAVFNFDIMAVSRLALEEIEQFRLASYTEKSQRYVTLAGDFVVPGEIRERGDRRLFVAAVERQNEFYRQALARLLERGKNSSDLSERQLEGQAKEDARYILSLATAGQVGMTLNARTLEHLFRRFRASRRQEVRRLGEKLFALVLPIAPSLILFTEPSAFELDVHAVLEEKLASRVPAKGPRLSAARVTVECVGQDDDRILASFLACSRAMPLARALAAVRRLSAAAKKEIFRAAFRRMEFFDAPPREFEMAEVTVQAVISSSCFAQLKRHRLATLLVGPYSPRWGVTVPPALRWAGLEKEFRRVIAETEKIFFQFKGKYGGAADYLLTNAHRRPVLLKMNLRELYHFIRLRDDDNAQWDIRQLAATIGRQVKKQLPLSSLLLCGKSQFVREFRKIYQREPAFKI